jgi:hypothetical protein
LTPSYSATAIAAIAPNLDAGQGYYEIPFMKYAILNVPIPLRFF